MCMVAAGVTREFGVLACDSAMYDTEKGQASFEANKLIMVGGKKVMSFIGTHLYLARVEKEKLYQPFDGACLYMKDYLKKMKPEVEKAMADAIADEDERQPHFCLFLMGLHRGYPTLAQFNSFSDFEPKYLWSENGLKFATILYGDDSKPEKKEVFKEATQYMEMKAKSYENVTPGIVGEILTRGIYRKADAEQQIGLKKKYAGGIVNAAVVNRETVGSLSGFLSI